MRMKPTVAAVLLTAGSLLLPSLPAHAATATVTVDFTKPVTTLEANDYGLDITGYGNQHYITNDTTHRENVRKQGFGVLRMELMYDAAGWCVAVRTAIPRSRVTRGSRRSANSAPNRC
ncbi:hypothetical protein GCM10029976_046820 [Kribbella albertanoniae]